MRFIIEVEVIHVSGKFVSRDDIAERLEQAINDSDMYGLGDEGNSEYQIEDVSVGG